MCDSVIFHVDVFPLIPELDLVDDLFLLSFCFSRFFMLTLWLNFCLFEIGNRDDNFLDKIQESVKVVIWVDTTDVATAFKQLFQLQLHEFIEVELL